ncbi:MAG TPA: FkbM family methyltransferase [Solirubrobacteraceae bacterium]|jgi:FkbM family methyltransferase|nr:FkbM family methyltransferase [Solirubrobacteraceae bacterium]
MGTSVRASFKRASHAALRHLGREEQARQLLAQFREARLTFDPNQRRELRDDHATHVVLAAVLGTGSNAIDIGANEGAVLSQIVHLAPNGRHIAFEPIPELCEQLVVRFPDVDIHCTAASDKAGSTEFSHVVGAPAYSGLRQRAELPAEAGEVRLIPVRLERLDDIVGAAYIPTLLKIDVEGAELGVLRGAIEMLERHRPHVLFEHGAGGADLYGTHPTEVFDLLTGVGLRIFDLDGEGPYSRARFEETFTEPIWNFLATP